MSYCPVCGFTGCFEAGGWGGGQRICPKCTSRARNRSVARWIGVNLGSYKFRNVLEIGQFHNLGPVYQRLGWAWMIVDIKPPQDGNHVSLCADAQLLPLSPQLFDLVVALHFLEHVEHDTYAYAELIRVLKPEGTLVVQVPYTGGEKTVEYGELRKEEMNHWRAPGFDYIERLKMPGLSVEWIQQSPFHGKLNQQEWFYVVRKEMEA